MKVHVFYLIDGEYLFRRLKAVDEIEVYDNVCIYAFTSDKEFAKIFMETHDMDKFIHKVIDDDRDTIMKKLVYENDDKELYIYDTLSRNGVDKILMTEFEYNLTIYGFPEMCYDLTISKGLFVSFDDMNKYKKKFSKLLDSLHFGDITDLVGFTDYPSEYDMEMSIKNGEWDQSSIYKFIFSDLLKEVL